MKKIIFILIVGLLVGGSIYTISTYNKQMAILQSNANMNTASESSTKTNNTEANSSILKSEPIRTKAKDFKLKDLTGKEISLSDLKGKNVYLNFWATWCPPCKGEMPEIEKLYQETKDSNLVIIAVEIGEPISTVKNFIDENKYTFKVLLDSDQNVAQQYGVSSIPTSYFIDKNGNIVSKIIGAMDINQMKEAINALDK